MLVVCMSNKHFHIRYEDEKGAEKCPEVELIAVVTFGCCLLVAGTEHKCSHVKIYVWIGYNK